MNQNNLRLAEEQEIVRHNLMMTILSECNTLWEENSELKQRANHDDADCRSFADSENNDDF